MLVLTRKSGEALMFTTESGEVIQLKLIVEHGDRIRCVIDAPKSVTIARQEVFMP